MSQLTPSTRKINLQFAAVQGTYWICFFCLSGFMVVLLRQKGFSASEIGVLLSVQAISSIFAQPIISSFAEKHRRIPLKYIVDAQIVVAIVMIFILRFVGHQMIIATLIFMVLGASIYSSLSLINAIAMQIANSGIPINYGTARGVGSLMFAVTGVILGRVVERYGVEIIIPAFIICATLSMLIVTTMYAPTAIQEDPHEHALKGGFRELISFFSRYRTFAGFCLASILLFANHAFLNTYIPDIVDRLGGSKSDQGLVRSIAAFVELPIMAVSALLVTRIKAKKLLIISALFFAIKGLMTFFSGSLTMLFAVQLLQIPAYGLYFPLSVMFADRAVADRDRVRAQAYVNVAGMGIGMVVGNFVGGIILDYFDVPVLLFSSFIAGILGFAVMLAVLYRYQQPGETKLSGNSSPIVNET